MKIFSYSPKVVGVGFFGGGGGGFIF